MKATYNPKAKTSFKITHRKEGKCFFESISIIDLKAKPFGGSKRLNAVVELRLYGTGNMNFACLWVFGSSCPKPFHTQGSGSAGGYGYHRPLAAAGSAISNAGFSLNKDISGVGDSAVDKALCAIADCLGIKNYGLFRSHP